MKRGRDEEKIMGPMFPRLHVNDTDKGGPRAPPRNKMALYEQLSIPSQRFSHAGGGNERGMFFSQQVPPLHPSEKQYSQYSDLNTPLPQIHQRKQKSDKDDFTVPIFIDSAPDKGFHNKFSNDVVHVDQEELSSLNPPYFFNHSFQFENGKGEKLDKSAKSNSSFIENTERNSSNVKKHQQAQNIVNDVSFETGSHEDGSCRSLQRGNLERTESVSETSMLDNVSGLDITPEDVLGIIGQKHFWNARRAIVNQQRVFSVQVFELHRLIKVQRSIAASPHLLQEDSACSDKPMNAKKLPSAYTLKPLPHISKPQKPVLDKPSHNKEASAENTVDKAQSPPPQTRAPPPSCKLANSSSPPSVLSNERNPTPWSFNHMQGGPHHQWLIPVMSPSEGLVYKPMMMGSNFLAPPAYGAPPPQYHFPSLPPGGPHGYFPSPYMMGPTAAFSGSSVQQTDPTPVPDQSNFIVRNRDGPAEDALEKRTRVSEDREVHSSSESSRTERLTAGGGPVEGRNMLPLFPTSSADDNSNTGSEAGPEGPIRVIKVVPRNGVSASESAARIFRSIQEERKQYDSV